MAALIAVVLGAVGGLLMTARATAMYQSSVTFYVSTPSDAAGGGNAYQANQYAVAKIQSYTKLLNSDALASRIIAVTDVDLTPGEVSSRISSSSGLNTVLLTATVTDSSVERALNIAGAIGSEFGTLVDGLDNRTDEDGRVGSTVELNVISGPTVNPDPVSPNSAVNLALGVLAGLLLGVGLASLRGLLDTTIRSADALEEFTGLPSLGRIPLESSRRKSPILIGDQLRSVRAEAYRQIRTNLQFMDLDDPIQVLLVASSVPHPRDRRRGGRQSRMGADPVRCAVGYQPADLAARVLLVVRGGHAAGRVSPSRKSAGRTGAQAASADGGGRGGGVLGGRYAVGRPRKA